MNIFGKDVFENAMGRYALLHEKSNYYLTIASIKITPLKHLFKSCNGGKNEWTNKKGIIGSYTEKIH